MQARERIIRERFAAQTCASCGHSYAPADVLVLARRQSTWMVLATCTQCDHRGIFLVSFPSTASEQSPQAQAATATQQPPEVTRVSANALIPQRGQPDPITAEDVAQLHAFLAGFDGDFKRLFGG